MECAFCGRVVSRKKWGKDKVGWQCMAAIKKGKKDCNNSKVIPQNVLEKAFIDVHKMLLANTKKLAEVNKKITKNAGISKAEERIHERVSNMKKNLKANKNIIEYFYEYAYKCLIKNNSGRK